MKVQKTYQPTPADSTEQWYVVDASGLILGRLASRVAKALRGKTSPRYAPHTHLKTHVIVINAEKTLLTGSKLKTKRYFWHSGYRTGIKSETAEEALARHPERIIFDAVHGMLPKDALGRQLMRHIRVYAGPEHPHQAQKPVPLPIHTRAVRAKE